LNNLDIGSGSLWATIAAAHNGDTVVFAPSLAGQTITLTGGELVISKSLEIEGLGAAKLTVSGNDTGRVFDIVKPGANVTIAGLTISHGLAVQGGGIDNLGKLIVSDCILTDNVVAGGTGVTARGGGIFNEAGGKLTVSDTTFTGNRALGGDGDGGAGGYGIGGGFANQGTASVVHNTFTDNLAQGGAGTSVGDPYVGFGVGGAIANEHGGRLTVAQCMFTDNRAVGGLRRSGSGFVDGIGAGGAISNGATLEFLPPTLTITDSTFTGNRAVGGPGEAGVDSAAR
jgi:hypothetical protein